MEQENKFLGTERVGKLLRKFAIPCVVALVIQALYNIVDQLFIGNCASLGSFGNTATGIVYPLTVIALALSLWFGDGTAARMSLNQGQNNNSETPKVVGTSIFVAAAISIVLVAVSFAARPQILRGFGATDETYAFSFEYSTFIICGFPFFILATVLNSVIRADGSPIYAMLSMAVGAVVNIALDPIFIFAFNMGMTGAALATFIAQVVSFVMCVAYLFRTKTFKLKFSDILPKFSVAAGILKLGISSFLTQVAIVVISVVNNNILLKLLPGDFSAIGMLTIAFKVFGIVISIVVGIAIGGQPIIGYNYGAKKYDRVKETFKKMMIATICVGAISTVLFEAAPVILLKMFGYNQISEFGLGTFRIYLSFILFTCMTKATSIFFQAIGKPVRAALITMCRDLLFLVPLTLLLSLGGINLFLWSAPISDSLTMIMATIFLIQLFRHEFSDENSKMQNAEKETVFAQNSVIFPSKPGKIVTISREHGAGGREIGMILAKMMAVPYFDKELTYLAAKESGLDEKFIDDVENKSLAVYDLYLGLSPNVAAISAQNAVLEKIAKMGSCVIVGRAADDVLKKYDIVKVFIYAPMDYKIERIMKNYGDNKNIAQKNIIFAEKRRANFYRLVTGKIWGKKENYDLVIDGSVGPEETAKIIYNYLDVRK